jgi:hypothetical protein
MVAYVSRLVDNHPGRKTDTSGFEGRAKPGVLGVHHSWVHLGFGNRAICALG